MKRKIRHFEPFIFLPMGTIQDTPFYLNPALVEDCLWLKEKIFLYLENQIILDNIVRVINCKNSVIIIHIYPLQYKEPLSGRGGQVLVIGYIVSRELIRKYLEGVIFRINFFFSLIEQMVRLYYNLNSFDIATDFVKMINDAKCRRHEFVETINAQVIKSNNGWHQYTWNKAQKISAIHHKEKKVVIKTPEGSSNLIELYKYLHERRFPTCILFYNCKNDSNYTILRKKRVELLQVCNNRE